MKKLPLACATLLAFGQPALADEWFVEAHFPDDASLLRATARFQHAIVDRQRHVLKVDTDDAGIAALEADGLDVSIDMEGTTRLRGFQARMQEAIASGTLQLTGGGYPSIPGYACYRTVEGAYQTMDDLAADYPELATIEPIGDSWERTQDPDAGHEMRVLRVTNLDTLAADPDRPRFVAFGSIHAREYTPAELLTRFAEWLVDGYGTDAQATWLVDHVDFRLILMANPDGRKKAESGVLWRKNTNTDNGACPGSPNGSYHAGIDLNRNFPFHWNNGGSSSYACDQTYRGPSAGSEPETQNLVSYVAGTPGKDGVYAGGALPDRRVDDGTTPAPDDYAGLFFDIHSYQGLVLWSWGDVYSPAPNDAALRTLGRRMAWFNGYQPKAAVELYPTSGATDDTFYGLLGAPSYTFELGYYGFFESCSEFQNTTYPENLAALKYAARAVQAPYRLPYGPDVRGISAEKGPGGTYATLTATVDDTHFSNANGNQTTHVIAGANAYIDTPPWAPGAIAIPLQAVDGAFDEKTESVQGDIALNGLSPGRHLVYVQGVNVRNGGTAGAPDAVFVEVPATTAVTVTPTTLGPGSIDPSSAQTVPPGTTLAFTVSPATGHHVANVAGCPGTFAPPVFTTVPLAASCTLVATFTADLHAVGGTISGLEGDGLVVTLNDASPLEVPAGATSFTFPAPLAYGTTYTVAVASQPTDPAQTCEVTHGDGTINGDVTDVSIACKTGASDVIFRDGFEAGAR